MCVSLMHQDMRLLILYSHWLMDLMMVLYYQRKYMYMHVMYIHVHVHVHVCMHILTLCNVLHIRLYLYKYDLHCMLGTSNYSF